MRTGAKTHKSFLPCSHTAKPLPTFFFSYIRERREMSNVREIKNKFCRLCAYIWDIRANIISNYHNKLFRSVKKLISFYAKHMKTNVILSPPPPSVGGAASDGVHRVDQGEAGVVAKGLCKTNKLNDTFYFCIKTSCEPICWQPVGRTRSARPIVKYQNPPSPKKRKKGKKVPQKDSALRLRPYGESLDLWVFPKLYPPVVGQPKKSISRLPTGPRGRPKPIMVKIHLVVWVPNRTNTPILNRQKILCYVYEGRHFYLRRNRQVIELWELLLLLLLLGDYFEVMALKVDLRSRSTFVVCSLPLISHP